MRRRRPAVLWVALVALGLISLGQIGAGFQRAPAIFLVSAVLNVALLIGLYLGHRWAYVLTLLFCVAGAVSGFVTKPSSGLLILAINGLLVAMPVILSSAYFCSDVPGLILLTRMRTRRGEAAV